VCQAVQMDSFAGVYLLGNKNIKYFPIIGASTLSATENCMRYATYT